MEGRTEAWGITAFVTHGVDWNASFDERANPTDQFAFARAQFRHLVKHRGTMRWILPISVFADAFDAAQAGDSIVGLVFQTPNLSQDLVAIEA
ncbi:MAG: hypothetical protein R3E66_20025 [bacterium]